MRVTLIVNPTASSVTEDRLGAVADALSAAVDLDVRRTDHPGHCVELARAADGDAVVVFSGDGGYNEALNGLRPGVPVGFLPGGRTNVLPRALGLPRDPVQAAGVLASSIANARTRTVSLGRVNGRRFATSAGLGFDAALIRRLERHRTVDGLQANNLVLARTVAEVLLEQRARFEPALEIKGVGRAAFALVANCDPYTYLGAVPVHVSPRARLELGLDLVAPVAVGPAVVPRLLAYALSGRGHERARDLLFRRDSDRIEVRCDEPLPLQADGEDLGDITHAVFEAERDAIRVFVP